MKPVASLPLSLQPSRRLLAIQYERNDYDFSRGKVRVRGDVVEIFPAYRQDALRVEFFGEEIERLKQIAQTLLRQQVSA